MGGVRTHAVVLHATADTYYTIGQTSPTAHPVQDIVQIYVTVDWAAKQAENYSFTAIITSRTLSCGVLPLVYFFSVQLRNQAI